jgi:hypothetical protein
MASISTSSSGRQSLRLNAGGGGQRIESLRLEERGALLVEHLVVAIDVAQVAAGAHDVVPGAAFAGASPVMLSSVRFICARKSPMCTLLPLFVD